MLTHYFIMPVDIIMDYITMSWQYAEKLFKKHIITSRQCWAFPRTVSHTARLTLSTAPARAAVNPQPAGSLFVVPYLIVTRQAYGASYESVDGNTTKQQYMVGFVNDNAG